MTDASPLRAIKADDPSDTEIVRLFLEHQRHRNLKPSTLRGYRLIFARLRKSTARRLTDMDHRDIVAWLDTCEQGPRARYQYISVVSTLYRWMVREGYTTTDPTLRIDRPRLPRRLPRPMGDAEFQQALASATPRMRCWLLLGAYEGLRCQEMAGLCGEDVLSGLNPPMLIVAKGKGSKQRIVPLNPRVLEALEAHGLPRAGPVFPRTDTRADGRAVTPQDVSETINPYLHSLGITATAHQLRHMFGTKFYAATKDLRLTQEMMGHSDPSTTAIYVAYSPEAAVAPIQAFGCYEDDR